MMAMAHVQHVVRWQEQVHKILGGFDTKFRRSEDTDFCIKHSLLGSHFVGIRTPLVKQIMTLSEDKISKLNLGFSN